VFDPFSIFTNPVIAAMSLPTSKHLEDAIVQEELANPGGTKGESIPMTTHIDNVDSEDITLGNFVYTEGEEEPEIHVRTWIAYGSMLLLIYCQNMSLSGPPSVVSIGTNVCCLTLGLTWFW
jgi:hypothetical protein